MKRERERREPVQVKFLPLVRIKYWILMVLDLLDGYCTLD